MESSTTELGGGLHALFGAAEHEIIICAPFMKEGALEKLLSSVSHRIKLTVYTRWKLEEIAAGVSDPGIIDLVEARSGAVWLCDELHAKYYRSDDRIVCGSANVTRRGLGWTNRSNLEILVTPSHPGLLREEFEDQLVQQSRLATRELGEELVRLAEEMQLGGAPVPDDVDERSEKVWFPSLRSPWDLHSAYTRGPEHLSRVSGKAASRDLAILGLPLGLTRGAFYMMVFSRLITSEPVRWLDDGLERGSLRFGAVLDIFARQFQISRGELREKWQTLMRWLMEFASDRYVIHTPRYSEIIELKRKGGEGSARSSQAD